MSKMHLLKRLPESTTYILNTSFYLSIISLSEISNKLLIVFKRYKNMIKEKV